MEKSITNVINDLIESMEENVKIHITVEFERPSTCEGDDESFGERLKRKRKIKGFTQRQAAKKVGVSATAWQGYERNEYAPKASILYDITKMLGCSADYLLYGEQ